jgi:hypothetical protein
MEKKKLLLYHGSNNIVEKPCLAKGKKNNDYGQGFYCTEDIELAKEWAVDKNRDGYVNKYLLDVSELKILNLSNKANVLNWITILLKNRVFELKSDISNIGKRYLIENFSLSLDDYDVVIGYRADDSYFSFAESFLNNTISVERLKEALKLGDLGEQIVLISEKAFNSIKFIGYEVALSSIYFPLREDRNHKARSQFLQNKKGINIENSLYLSDIMKGDFRNDPRIQ